MPSDYTLRTRQSELNRLRQDLHRASEVVATARTKAARARDAASRSKSESTIKSKLSEAAREEKRANGAEARRAGIEKRIAEKEKAVTDARSKYDKEVAREQQRALREMTASIEASERQFRPLDGSAEIALSGAGRNPIPTERTDVFISHATEDKAEVARPLHELLTDRGIKVWYDELSIAWGQPLSRAIERGIATATYGLVIISPSFLKKSWTQAELDGLYGRQMAQPDGYGLILPVWHRITADEVRAKAPMIASYKALNTSIDSLESIADQLAHLVKGKQNQQDGGDPKSPPEPGAPNPEP